MIIIYCTLGYFYFVEKAEKKNNVLEKFIIKTLSEIYLHNTNFSKVMKNFKEIINYNQYLSWVQLEALTLYFKVKSKFIKLI